MPGEPFRLGVSTGKQVLLGHEDHLLGGDYSHGLLLPSAQEPRTQ